MPRYASSIDVARLAGVSQSAVSRTYRPGARVSAKTRQKVLLAAEQLGYRPSMIPQIMLNNRSHVVALVIGGMYNPFYARVLEEFTTQLHASGHQALIVHVDSGHSLDSVIPRLASYRVDAIVSALAVLSPDAAEALAKFKIPVVSFNTPVKNEWVSSISQGRGPRSPTISARAARAASPT
jgi:DNA-binding LacI/PurR family transcriptional regulator